MWIFLPKFINLSCLKPLTHDIILCLFLSFQVRLNASCIKNNKGKNCDKLCESQEIIHFRIQNVVFPAAEIAAMEELHSPEKALGKKFNNFLLYL